ncbi:MAG: TonB-dependent receptor [Verrucomicrobiales bacterium]|nr:TonB-dependent receptor [Verrucomicrobiales bacterium]
MILSKIQSFILTNSALFAAAAGPVRSETLSLPAPDTPAAELPEVIVTGKGESLLGSAPAASKGQSNAEELTARPYLRRGELLEVVPGVIITQHSGDGKANQYFLRGFNLDHGTDFGVFIDGMPVNLRTHAHGQGYADLNPLLPELVDELSYRKGPYFADFGDLSAAGAARFHLVDRLPQGIASVSLGGYNYFRGLVADTISLTNPAPIQLAPVSGKAPQGKNSKQPVASGLPGAEQFLTYALEYSSYDGPWDMAEKSRRWNGLLRYVWKDAAERFSVTAMGYDGRWLSTDQVPQRAIDRGLMGRFGAVDTSDRGASSRYSLMAEYEHQTADGGTWHADVFAGFYDLTLFSNFTYFLDNPERGDQFEQSERRWMAGGTVRRDWKISLGTAAQESRLSLGLDTRHDWIDGIGLYKTERRQRYATTRQDDVYEASAGIFADAELRFNDWFRIAPGLRGDLYHFDVSSDDSRNSGTDWDGLVSPKLNVVFGPWAKTEIYVNSGIGFHSNDARGVLTRRDPVSGDAVSTVDPLVRLYGAELGIRTEAMRGWVHTLSLWHLESDSELVYVGDAGTNEAGPGSRRYGVELSSYWRPNDWLSFDSEFTLTHARFKDAGDADHIPGSVPVSWSGGLTLGKAEGLYGALRARYFGRRPLEESGSIKSKDSIQVNARIGWRYKNWDIALECLNLFDRKDNDIEYHYDSRLPGEALTGMADTHIHPVEPRSLRVNIGCRF